MHKKNEKKEFVSWVRRSSRVNKCVTPQNETVKDIENEWEIIKEIENDDVYFHDNKLIDYKSHLNS